MINFYDGELIDLIPDNFKNDPVVQAISYALSNAVKRIIEVSRQASVYAAIDLLDESIIDLLAVELRTKYYSDTFTLQEKREMIKRTMLWYYKAGTLSTVKELTDFVFENAEVEEWFQYAGAAFLFRLIVNVVNQDLTLEEYLHYLQGIKEVKNTRSHLEAVIYKYYTEALSHTVAAGGVGNEIKIKARIGKAIRADVRNKTAKVIKINQNILIKADDKFKESDVYALSDLGEKIRVFTENGGIVKID